MDDVRDVTPRKSARFRLATPKSISRSWYNGIISVFQTVRLGFESLTPHQFYWHVALKEMRLAVNQEEAGSIPAVPANLMRGRLEVVPAWSHKPNYGGSTPPPATNFLSLSLSAMARIVHKDRCATPANESEKYNRY